MPIIRVLGAPLRITSSEGIYSTIYRLKKGIIDRGKEGRNNISQVIKSCNSTSTPQRTKTHRRQTRCLAARVDTCQAHLDRIPKIIKRFRQSVLAAATSGELTEDWRVEIGNPDWT